MAAASGTVEPLEYYRRFLFTITLILRAPLGGDGGGELPKKLNNADRWKLSFNHTLLIVDPTAEEEDLATGTVTTVTDEGRMCSVHKPGGSPLTEAKLQDCITRAITRHKEVKKVIDRVIKSIMPK